MAFDLTQFRIDRLHGRRSFDLRIDGNKLVLVGENGTGKTTVINILYYFLSRQWPRLAQYEFEKVTAVIDGREYVVKYEWLRNIEWLHESSHRRVRGHLSPRVVDQLYTMIAAEGGN